MSGGLTNYDRASLRLADAISRHDFSEREWRVLEFLRKASFGAGRATAYVPALKFFCAATGISRGNMSKILRRLKACQVIREEQDGCYGFMLLPPPGDPCANWRVPVRMQDVDVIRQIELLSPPPGLPDMLREGFIEASGQVKQGDARQVYIGVPESGTKILSRSRFGNDLESSMVAGKSCAVPDSGTTHVQCNNEQCNNASSKKHYMDIVSCAAPDSGTGTRRAERRELLDKLIKVGAFDPEKNDESKRFWFWMVKSQPAIVATLLGELKYASARRRIYSPGGWMRDLWVRWKRPSDNGGSRLVQHTTR